MKKLLALTALLIAATTANANPHETVKFDLRTAAGVKAAFNAISMAAENVCPYSTDSSPRYHTIYVQCRREAIESAVYRIADINLAAYAATHR